MRAIKICILSPEQDEMLELATKMPGPHIVVQRPSMADVFILDGPTWSMREMLRSPPPGLKIIIVSDNPEAGMLASEFRVAALTKPFDPQELWELICVSMGVIEETNHYGTEH